MEDNAVIRRILACCYHVHRELGPGYRKTTYQRALLREMERTGLAFTWEISIPVRYLSEEIDQMAIDFLVDNSVLLEVNEEHSLSREESARVFAALKASGQNRGLLIGFGGEELQIKRLAISPRQKG